MRCSHVRRVAIFSKLNGEYDDGARENAKVSVDAIIRRQRSGRPHREVTIIGCEGASTPFGYAFIDVDDKAIAAGSDKRLAFGLGHADPGIEAELDTPAFGARVKACVLGAMRDAGLGPDDVATVIVNGSAGDLWRCRSSKPSYARGCGARRWRRDRRYQRQ